MFAAIQNTHLRALIITCHLSAVFLLCARRMVVDGMTVDQCHGLISILKANNIQELKMNRNWLSVSLRTHSTLQTGSCSVQVSDPHGIPAVL